MSLRAQSCGSGSQAPLGAPETVPRTDCLVPLTQALSHRPGDISREVLRTGPQGHGGVCKETMNCVWEGHPQVTQGPPQAGIHHRWSQLLLPGSESPCCWTGVVTRTRRKNCTCGLCALTIMSAHIRDGGTLGGRAGIRTQALWCLSRFPLWLLSEAQCRMSALSASTQGPLLPGSLGVPPRSPWAQPRAGHTGSGSPHW